METKLEKTAQELGFKPQYQQLSDDGSEQYATACLMEIHAKETDDEIMTLENLKEIFVVAVVLKRIEVLKLPIKFTNSALLAMSVLTDGVVGRGVAFLIDCLTKFEGKTVNTDMISTELYPSGFYSEESFVEYVDDYLKAKKVKWSEIY